MKRLGYDTAPQRDERVAAMLDRHVQSKGGSAPIFLKTDGSLQKRLDSKAA